MTRTLPKFFIHLTALVLVLAGAAVAIASRSDAEAPPPEKPLPDAIRDALAAPAPEGVSGRIEFSNGLVDADAAPGGATSPLLAGAEGRFWVSDDGRARLELQSPAGDAQIQLDGDRVTVYDPASDTVYTAALPHPVRGGAARPGVAEIQRLLGRLARGATLSGARPGTVAGEPAYTVRVAPRHDGGLLGAAELAWDAAHGMPLRAAVYAQGEPDPVLELRATEVRFGAVSDDAVAPPRPAGARVVEIDAAAAGESVRDGVKSARDAGKSDRNRSRSARNRGGTMGQAAAFDAVQAHLSFPLSAPDAVAGLPLRSIRTLRADGRAGALVTYGKGLGALMVVQSPAGEDDSPASELPGLQQLSIGGATARELATALGTVVQFERDGVAYTVIGSVPPAAAEAAARAL